MFLFTYKVTMRPHQASSSVETAPNWWRQIPFSTFKIGFKPLSFDKAYSLGCIRWHWTIPCWYRLRLLENLPLCTDHVSVMNIINFCLSSPTGCVALSSLPCAPPPRFHFTLEVIVADICPCSLTLLEVFSVKSESYFSIVTKWLLAFLILQDITLQYKAQCKRATVVGQCYIQSKNKTKLN